MRSLPEPSPVLAEDRIGKRKIVYVVTRMIVGGAQETAKRTAEHFRSHGHDVLLVTGEETGREGKLDVDVPTLVVPWLVRAFSPRKDLPALWRLYRLFRAEHPDVVHTRTAKARILSVLPARLARVDAVVQTIHGYSFNNEIDRRRSFYILLERLAARLYHRTVVVSEQDLRQGLDLGILKPERTQLIPSGVDLRKVTAPTPSEVARLRKQYAPNQEAVVTLVGRLSMPKTPDIFVRAAARVAQGYPNVRFLMVGDGPKREEVASLIRGLGLEDRVMMLGLRLDVPELMHASDIIVHSSTHEGLPKTVLEGMAAGRAIVATSTGGVPEVIQDGVTGLLVEPTDPEGLASKIEQLLSDPPLRNHLGTNALLRVTSRSLDRTIEATAALYETLLIGGGNGRPSSRELGAGP